MTQAPAHSHDQPVAKEALPAAEAGELTRMLPLALLALAGATLAVVQTRLGPGANGDSVRYVMGAETILAGQGYARIGGDGALLPVTGFPPFFSAVLASAGIVLSDLYQAARWLHVLLLGANVALAGLLVFRSTRSGLAAAIAALFLVTSDTLLRLHSWVLTEPLYIFLAFASLYLLLLYLEQSRRKLLLLAAALMALATLTRFVGFSLIAAGGLAILLFGPSRLRQRLTDLILFASVSVAPVLLWFLRNSLLADTVVNRELGFHLPNDPNLVRFFLAEASSWFVPHEVPLPTGVRAAIAVLIAVTPPLLLLARQTLVTVRSRFRTSGGRSALAWLLVFYVASYVLVLAANSLLLDAGTSLGATPRYLAPVYAVAVVLLVTTVFQLLSRWHAPRAVWSLVLIYAIALLAFNATELTRLLLTPVDNMGIMAYRLSAADVREELEGLDPALPIVSDNPELIYLLSGRSAYMRPIEFDHSILEFREDFPQQVDATREKLERGGVYVLFDYQEPEELKIIDLLGASPQLRFADAIFYELTGGSGN